MTKAKPSAAQLAAELRSIEMRPPAEAKKLSDALVRTLLNTPPDPHVTAKKPKKRAK